LTEDAYDEEAEQRRLKVALSTPPEERKEKHEMRLARAGLLEGERKKKKTNVFKDEYRYY
jgi:hypothetical protein